MPHLPLTTKRLITGTALAVLMAAVANLYVTRAFGVHDRQVVVVAAILLTISIMYVGPSPQDVRDSRNRRRSR